MKVRAKFKCTAKQEQEYYLDVSLEPVTPGTDENDHFAEATPSGGLSLGGIKREVFDAFEIGREYDILITPNQEVNS